jgi:hypothetical protein
MTVLAMDSQSWIQSNAGLGTDNVTRYDTGHTGVVNENPVPLFPGTYFMSFDSGEELRHDIGDHTGGGIFFVGFFFRVKEFPIGGARIISIFDSSGSNRQMYLFVTEFGKIQLADSANAIIATATRRIVPDAWYHFELKFAIKNSIAADDVILKIDGEEHINLPATTDTQSQPTDSVQFIELAGSNPIADLNFSHFWILDDNGSFANDFIGPTGRIELLHPVGNGNYSQFVGSDGNSVNNFELVDELDPDDDTTYVESSVVSERDSYMLTNLAGTPLAGNIEAVQLITKAKKEGGTEPRTAKHFVRISSTDFDQGSGKSLTDGAYTWFFDIMADNPNTAARWTATQVDALEVGVKIES